MNRFSLEFLSSHRTLWLLLSPIAVALAVWVYYGTLAPLGRPTRTVLRLLRGLALLIVLFALAEPVLTLVLPEPGKPGLAVLVDNSASMRFPGDDPGSKERAEEAGAIEGKITDRLHARFRLDRFQFGTTVAKEEGDRPDPAGGGSATPGGNTAIGDALHSLASRQGSRPVGAVVLLSDGASTVGSDPVGAAREVGIPVFPVRIGGTLPPPDARILSVRANPVAYSGEPAAIEAQIASSGLAGKSLELRVEDQGRLLASRPVLLGSGDEIEQSVRLDARPVSTGLRRWEVRLVDAKDAVPENDARSVAVKVLERKTRVLFVEGRLDWDFSFLRRTFAADSTFRYRFLVADRNGRWLPEPGSAESHPSGPGDLRDYAAVILGEVPGSALPGGFYAALSKYVDEGGGLLVIGGRTGISRLRGSGLDPILPAEVTPVARAADRPVGIRLEPQGLTHPLTAIEESPGRSEADWASLPPVWPSPDRLRPRPGSSVLLGFTVPGGTDPALISGYSGQGKVVLLAAHDFWRWDFLPHGGAGTDPFPEFALRTIRWLAEPAARERFTAEPTRGVFENGEIPEFTARVWDETFAPVLDAAVHLRITSADSAGDALPIREIDLRVHGSEGTFVGDTDPLPPGAYRFVAEARAAAGGATIGRVESTFWVDRNGPEYIRLRPDPGTMDQIARASGGESIDRSGLDGFLDRLPNVVHRVGRIREIDVWNHLALFLSFVAVLSVEWWLRRRRGLA